MALKAVVQQVLASCLVGGVFSTQPKPLELEFEHVREHGITDNPALAKVEKLILDGGRLGQPQQGPSLGDLPLLRSSVDTKPEMWLVSSEGVPCYTACRPDGRCCIDPSCAKSATCGTRKPEPVPLLWPRDLPRSSCRLPTLGGSFAVEAGRGNNKITVFLFRDDSEGSWKVEDLTLALRLSQDLDVQFVFLSYSPTDVQVERAMKQLGSRLQMLSSNISSNGDDNNNVPADIHLVTEPAWHIPVQSCWLPSLLHSWSHLEPSLVVASVGDQAGLPTMRGRSIRGHWSRVLQADGVQISGPLRWAGFACSGKVEADPQWTFPESHNLTGAVAVVSRGHCSFYQKARNALAAGAQAVVVVSHTKQPITMGCAAPDPCKEVLDVYVVMVGERAGKELLDAMFPPSSNLTATRELEAQMMAQQRGPQIVGLLADQGGVWPGSGNGLKGLEEEILGMDYQRRLMKRQRELQAKMLTGHDRDSSPERPGAARIQIFRDQSLPGWLVTTWDREQAAMILENGYDALDVELHLDCDRHLDSNCPPWDHELNLFLCRQGSTSYPRRCRDKHASVARWITPYGREGRWISDATAALPLLLSAATSNETSSLHLVTLQHHIVTLIFWFSRSRRPRGIPLARMPLWEGGRFDLGYNPSHQAMHFNVPPGASRVVLSMLLTGHGWGTDIADCAEFCNHTHHFQVNDGQELVKAHPVAGTSHGCFDQVLGGVVPNQHGTWPFGRAGWCPGRHVDWWEVDVTEWLSVPGFATNTITYRALYNGSDYTPQEAQDANSMGFPAEIHLASFLTFYGERQASASSTGETSILFP